MNSGRVATLAVGTEITDGQISDRNSQWLSARVVDLGYEVVEHRAVADDRDKILQSLRELSQSAQLILVTGGLGPTSDDFTRECIAAYLNEPLEWHEPSWASIVERLKLRGARVTENQRQQCYYPRSATILKNTNGTANAFTAMASDGTRIVSLPGPPGEIEVIWKDKLRELITQEAPVRRRELTILRTMGLGEGALADGVEAIVDRSVQASDGVSRPEIGYRAHAPYVEIKIWGDTSQSAIVDLIAREIRLKFKDILVNEGHQDVADAFLVKIQDDSDQGLRTLVIDRVTRGGILTRLHARMAELKNEKFAKALEDSFSVFVSDGSVGYSFNIQSLGRKLTLSIGENELELLLGQAGAEKKIAVPKLAGSLRSERGRKWAIEYALREWGQA